MEVLPGKRPFLETRQGTSEVVLLTAFYEVEGFHLRAFNEFEAYFDDPVPYLEIDLTSAAVIARTARSNGILLVEFRAGIGQRRVELPAGKVESGKDKTIFDTAARELNEETGGMVTPGDLKSLCVQYHRDGRGGLQFYTEIPEPDVERTDDEGRGYVVPPKGTDKGRVVGLITEPLGVFLDPKKTLLRHSQNPWAVDDVVRKSLELYIKKLDTIRS